MTLQLVAPNLWEISRPLRLPGIRMEHRMTVIRLESGALVIHSPIAYEPALASALEALGRIEHFIAPSRFHDMDWPDWFQNFPSADFFAAPGVREDHPKLPFQPAMNSSGPFPWSQEMDQALLEGMPSINEVVFFHRPTRSLIVADLIFNLNSEQNFLGRLFLKWNRLERGPNMSRLFRFYIKDRERFRRSLARIVEWGFDRVIMGHGKIIHQGGRELLSRLAV